MEFVKDKESKKPFPVGEKIAWRIHEVGLQREHGISLIPGSGNVDGVDGDMVAISPAFNITRADVELIVERTVGVVHAVFGV